MKISDGTVFRVLSLTFALLFGESFYEVKAQDAPNPPMAAETVTLWQELQAIDEWECDLFKPQSWITIADSLSWALSQPRKADQSVEIWLSDIKKDNFAIIR